MGKVRKVYKGYGMKRTEQEAKYSNTVWRLLFFIGVPSLAAFWYYSALYALEIFKVFF